ncbi:LD-carboxypeptidase [Compostibacter hankyongensis]|uniref:LD-carboxypeptidase n=1 Tax=Compostibacter hankyongensis TaxID=1007089 RepID=A0ABP8G8L1_9BACT
MTIIPPYLKPGDTIGITSPGSYFSLEDAGPAIAALERWGYRVRTGSTLQTRFYQFAGTDATRAADLQQMLDDPEIRAIVCARGGYGTLRIIDRLDFNRFYLHPKWLTGYSDITVLHAHIQAQLHIPTLHAEMCIDLKSDTRDASAFSLRRALRGDRLSYEIPPDAANRQGTARGILVGGNLSLLAALAGSPSAMDTDGKILFLEDVAEKFYHIDSMLYTLRRSGRLSFLAGLLIGGFTRLKEDDEGPFGQTVQQIILDKVKEFDFPVCFGFPAGHQHENYALKLGLPYELTVRPDYCRLAEEAVSGF